MSLFESSKWLSESASSAQSPTSPQEAQDRDDLARSTRAKSLPHVKIQVHRDDIAFLAAKAPPCRDVTAWQRVFPLPGIRPRLMIVESRAAKQGVSRRRKGEVSAGWGILYEEGREWWSREAKI